METGSTSETLAYLYDTTQHSVPEDCHLHIRRRESLKSQIASTLQ
jgi:hypothetical protein